MKKVYYLLNCSTCKKIIKDLSLADHFELQNIKTNKITLEQLNQMIKLAGSASNLFSTRSRKYAALDKKLAELTEEEIKSLIMEEYTFLKRPVAIVGNDIFVGSSQAVIERLSQRLISEN